MGSSVESEQEPVPPVLGITPKAWFLQQTAAPGTTFCLSCGYDLHGITADDARCPECGFAVAESLKPEVRGFSGLIRSRRFRLSLWMLALSPLILLACGSLIASEEVRYRTATALLRQQLAFQTGQGTHAAYSQQYLQLLVRMTMIGWLLAGAIILVTLATILTKRPRADALRASLEPPRIISIRTAIIAFGSVIAVSLIPIAITANLAMANDAFLTGPFSVPMSLLIWAIAAALTWWLVSRVATGRVRAAFLVAAVLLIAALAVHFLLWHYLRWDDDLTNSLCISALALMSLGSGLIWRWLAKGFRMRLTLIAATLYAAAAPFMVAIGCGTITAASRELIDLPESLASPMLIAAASGAAILGSTICWKLRSIRKAQAN